MEKQDNMEFIYILIDIHSTDKLNWFDFETMEKHNTTQKTQHKKTKKGTEEKN